MVTYFALLSEQMQHTQELLQRFETLNTKYVDFNNKQAININTKNGSEYKSVNDFRYPGALPESTTKHIKFRKAAVWRAANELMGIWKSTLVVE